MNNLIATAKNTLVKTGFALKKHSPEILIVAGTVGTVTAAVMACKATLKAKDVLDRTKDQVEEVKEALAIGDEDYTEVEARKEIADIYVKTGLEFVKLYGPSVALGMLSVGTVFASNNILRKRNASLTAAYATVDSAFRRYRKNVVEQYGEEVDSDLRHNVKRVTIQETETDAKGKEKTVSKEVKVIDSELEGYSDFARFFDESSREWEPSSEYNLSFLKGMQNTFNDRLETIGYVFLNEVYEALDIPRTKAGYSVGWRKKPGDDTLGKINFGIYEYRRANQRFVNGYENVILLDFNVDKEPIIDCLDEVSFREKFLGRRVR